MKATKQIDIYLTKKRNVRLIDVVQYDTGIQLVFTVKDFTIPSGVTATLYVQKPSGKFVYQEDGITVSGNTITVDLHNQAITEHGKCPYQVSLKSGSDVITTFTGFLMVEKSLKNTGMTGTATVHNGVEKMLSTRATAIVCEAEGMEITVNDASDDPLCGLTVYGKSTQDGTPTPGAPVDIVSVEKPTITIGEQNINIPRTIHGIPVTSGGNYTDADGQQWICDEIDLERGVYVQRLHHHAFTGAEAFASFDNGAITGETFPKLGLPDCKVTKSDASTNKSNLLCNVGLIREQYDLTHGLATGLAVSKWGNPSFLYFDTATYGNAASLSAKMRSAYESGNPYEILYELKTPIETALTEAEINAFSALHSNYPNTTIQNDAGAWMKVKYVADTKTYIDNKFA